MSPRGGPAASGASGRRIVLIGFGPTSHSALRSLLASVDVVALVRAPADHDVVCDLAERNGAAVHRATSRAEVEGVVASIRPDLAVISSFNRALGPEILQVCPFINVHYAPLPRYRGNAPVNWALLNGEAQTAITIHRVDAGLDSGAILYQEYVPISDTDDASTLFERLNAIQERELGRAALCALAGDSGEPQNSAQATYGCARNPEDGEIDWRLPALTITRLTRALTPPFPGAFTHHQGSMLVVHRATVPEAQRRFNGRIPGRVVDVSPAEGWIDVIAGDGVVRVHEMSRSGEPPNQAARYVASRRARLGLSRLDLLARLGELEKRLARLETRRVRQSRSVAPHA
jgi:methionyl-tRNA formyltransferase